MNVCHDLQKMNQSEAKQHNQLCSVLHLNLLLVYVLRLEEQVKQSLGAVAGTCGGSVNDDWMRGSEVAISSAITKIDTVINETTDLRQKLKLHDQRLALLEGKATSHGALPTTSKHTPLQHLNMPAENGGNNMEFLIRETGRKLNDIKQEVRKSLP